MKKLMKTANHDTLVSSTAIVARWSKVLVTKLPFAVAHVDHLYGDGDGGDDSNEDLTPPSSKVSVLHFIFAGSDSKEQSRSITTLPFTAVSDNADKDDDDHHYDYHHYSSIDFTCNETSKIVGRLTSFHLARVLIGTLALVWLSIGNF